MTSDLPVSIFLNNTLYKTNQQIGKFQTRSWSYDNDNRRVSVSLKDDLEEWQDITIGKIEYDVRKSGKVNLETFYDYIYSKTPTKYNMMPFSELSPLTQSVLKNTYVNYKMLYSGNLWRQWNKLCQVSQSHIYKTGVGKTTFVYNGGI